MPEEIVSVTTTMVGEVDLIAIAAEINAAHAAVQQIVKAGLAHAMKIGERLMEVKNLLRHGEFEEWLEKNCDFSLRTARAYMRVFRLLPKTATVADLTFRDALKLLAKPHEQPEASDETTFITNRAFVPPKGTMLWGNMRDERLMIVPSAKHPGYYFVTRVSVFGEEQGAVAEGFKRPVREDAIETILAHLSPSFRLFAWEVLETAPWPVNVWLDAS